MINSDDVTTIVPDGAIPDAELRALKALDEAFEAALAYMKNVADARSSRGVDLYDLEDARDTLLDLRFGFQRARQRRERNVGTLVFNKRTAVGR